MSDRKQTTTIKDGSMDCPLGWLIPHTANANEPGIRFDVDGSSVVITFCPWCGKQVFSEGCQQ